MVRMVSDKAAVMAELIDILIVGTGRMAADHARRFAQIEGVRVLAAVDIDKAKLNEFCKVHDIRYAYTDLQEALRKHSFTACSVVTPDAYHATVSIACLQASLPVLCEKPLSDSVDSAVKMVEAAKMSGELTMVNLSYRASGALNRARELIDDGLLGEIRHVEASYRQSWLMSAYWGNWRTDDGWLWRLSQSHGSLGVLGDVGIHILDYVCAGVGMEITGLQCRLQTFHKAPGNRIADYNLDANDSCVMNIELSNGALGVVHMSRFYSGYQNDLVLSIHGDEGAVRVSTGSEGDKLFVSLGDDIHSPCWKERACESQPDTFDRFIAALRHGERPSPDFAHAARLQQYLALGFESHDTGRWVECN